MRMLKHLKTAAVAVCVTAAILMLCIGCELPDAGMSLPEKNAVKPEAKVLNFLFNSPEMTEQFDEMVGVYQHLRTDVRIQLEIRQNDYIQVLKTKINAGEVPDLFISSAYNDNKVYKNYSYDLSAQPFIERIEPAMLAGVTVGDSVTGVPLLVQSHSFIYNKALFEQAGIHRLPTTLEEYEAVCIQLSNAGITPFSTGFADWWVLPQTFYPSASDIGGGDYQGVFDRIRTGEKSVYDFPEISYALDVLDLVARYGSDNPMASGFEQQCSDFADGQVAMIHQGIWSEQTILERAPDIRLGYLYAPRLDGKSVIAVDSNLTFRVYKDSPMLDKTLAFLDWLYTSDYGKTWIPDRVKQISPIMGANMPDTQLSIDTGIAMIKEYTSGWWIFVGPDNIEQPLGIVLQNYVAGRSSKDEAMKELNLLFGGNGARTLPHSSLPSQ